MPGKRSVLKVKDSAFILQRKKAKEPMTGTKYIKLQPNLNPPKFIKNGFHILAPQERQMVFLPVLPSLRP